MSENVEDKKKRCDGHNIFFPNRRLVKCDQRVLGKLSGRRSGESRYRHSVKISRILHAESTLAFSVRRSAFGVGDLYLLSPPITSHAFFRCTRPKDANRPSGRAAER